MSPKLFDLQEREEARIKMLDEGFQLIREHGMTHASVEKITKAVGLGKSTFYNFFSSKEQFVYEIIKYQRDQAKQRFMDMLDGRDRITIPEAKEFFKEIIFSRNSIYQYLTSEDYEKLKKALPQDFVMDLNSEHTVITGLMTHIEGVKKDIDFRVTANLVKIMALAMLHQDSLHADALEQTLNHIYNLLFSCIFEEGA